MTSRGADSPVAQLAWNAELPFGFDGNAVKTLDREHFLTDASIYWFTRSIGTSMRFYRANALAGWPKRGQGRTIPVPTGFAAGPKEHLFLPRAWMAAETDLRRWTILPHGGHFLPMERPDLVAGALSEAAVAEA